MNESGRGAIVVSSTAADSASFAAAREAVMADAEARPFGFVYDRLVEFTSDTSRDSPHAAAQIKSLLYRHMNDYLYPFGKQALDSLDGSSASATVATKVSSGSSARVIDQMVGSTTVHKNAPPVSKIDVMIAKELASQINVDEVEGLNYFLLAKLRVHNLRPDLDVLRLLAQDQFAPLLKRNRSVQLRSDIVGIVNRIETAVQLIIENARLHFANERQYIFWTIADLMKARHRFQISGTNAAYHNKSVIMSFTNDLLKNGLPLRILETVKALIGRPHEIAHRQLTDTSVVLLAESVMFIFASSQATEAEIRGLYDLIRYLSGKLQSRERTIRSIKYEKVLLSLYCALMYALDYDRRPMLGDGTKERPGGMCANLSDTFYTSINSMLARAATLSGEFQSFLQMTFGLHLFRRSIKIERAVNAAANRLLRQSRLHGGCRFLEALVRGPCARYQDSDSLMYAASRLRCTILDYMEFLTFDRSDLNDEESIARLSTREELHQRATRGGAGASSALAHDTLEDVMETYAAICRLSPVNESIVDDTIANAVLREIILYAAEKLNRTYGHYESFVDFLSAIAVGGPVAAEGVYRMLEEGAKSEFYDCNFGSFFKKMHLVTQSLSGSMGEGDLVDSSEDRGVRRISPDNERAFQSIFRLITAVLRSPSVAQHIHDKRVVTVQQTNRGLSSLRVLFDMLCCPLFPATKAGIVRVITMFAKIRTEWALEIYEHIESRNLLGMVRLPTVRSSGGAPQRDADLETASGCDILYELEQVESLDKKYDLTAAMLRLLIALAPNIPPQLGAQWRAPGWWPYLSFITGDVFLKCMARQYMPGPRRSEKWEIAACSLAIMRDLLVSYNVNSSTFARDFVGPVGEMSGAIAYKSAGFRLMYDLLGKGGELLQTVIAVVTSHGIEGLEYADGVDSSAKQSFMTVHSDAPGREFKDNGMPKSEEEVQLWVQGVGQWTLATFEKKEATRAQFRVSGDAQAEVVPIWALGLRMKRQQKWKSWHRRAVQMALSVLELLLLKQRVFMDNCRQHLDKRRTKFGSDVLTPLQKLLTRSQIVSLSEFVRFGNDPSCTIPRLSARILFLLSTESYEPLAQTLFHDETRRLKLINGYAMRLREGLYGYTPGTPKPLLDPTLYGVFDDIADDADVPGVAQERHEDDLPRTIVEFLLTNLDNRTLNLSQMFLGFKERASVMSDVGIQRYESTARLIFDPACDETPLHVICDALSNVAAALSMPLLAEGCYQLLFELCRRRDTSPTTARFLRFWKGRNFFVDQLSQLPVLSAAAAELSTRNVAASCALSNICAWIMKSAALEIHLAVRSSPPRLHLAEQLLSQMFRYRNLARGDDTNDETRSADREQMRMGVFEVLDKMSSVQTYPTLPPEIRRIVRGNGSKFVEERTYGGHKFGRLNIVAIHRELSLSGAIQLGPKKIHAMLSAALRWNQIEQLVAAQQHMLHAWKQLVVVSFSEGFPALEDARRCRPQVELLCQLIETALTKIKQFPNARAGVIEPLAESVLMLFAMLRKEVANGFELSLSQYEKLLRCLLSSLLRCDGSANSNSHELRGSLYSALLIFLKLANASMASGETSLLAPIVVDDASLAIGKESDAFGAAMASFRSTDDETRSRYRRRERDFFSVVQRALHQSGERLVRLVARDSTIGLPVWKALSLSTIDALLARDRSGRFLDVIRHTGHLQRIVTVVGELPVSVLGPFDSVSEQAKAEERIAIYDKAMALLIRIAQTRKGSSLLLQSDVLSAVSSCQALEKEPDSSVTHHRSSAQLRWLVSSPVASFRRILRPALRLILSLSLSSSTIQGGPGHLKILHLLSERSSVLLWCLLEAVLVSSRAARSAAASGDEKISEDDVSSLGYDEEALDVLSQAELATGVLAYATRNPNVFEERVGLASRRYEQCMKRLLLSLASVANTISSQTSSESVASGSLGDARSTDTIALTIYMTKLRILRNVITFCRHQTTPIGPTTGSAMMNAGIAGDNWTSNRRIPYFDPPGNVTRKVSQNLATLEDVVTCVVQCIRRSIKLKNIAESRPLSVSRTKPLDVRAFESIRTSNVNSMNREERHILLHIIENLMSTLFLHFRQYKYKGTAQVALVPEYLRRLLECLSPLLKGVSSHDSNGGFLFVLNHQMRLLLRNCEGRD